MALSAGCADESSAEPASLGGASAWPSCVDDRRATISQQQVWPARWEDSEVLYTAPTFFSPTGSPVLVDLNADGCPDILAPMIGAAVQSWEVKGEPYFAMSGHAAAIDGATGELLWAFEAPRDLFALPVAFDGPAGRRAIVFGGRLGYLAAVDAVDGALLWTAPLEGNEVDDLHLNYFNPIPVGDVNGDGIEDLFVAYGGWDLAEPHRDRPPSYLGVVNGADGTWLMRRMTPDRRETYMSPLRARRMTHADPYDTELIIGTGGETHQGAVWRIRLDDLRHPDDGSAYGTLIYEVPTNHGMLAPVTLLDIPGASRPDIIVNPVGSSVTRIDGETNTPRWVQHFDGEESNVVVAPARLLEGRLALAITTHPGVFPDYFSSVHRVLDSEDGSVLWEYATGTAHASASPITVPNAQAACDDILFFATDFGAMTTEFLHWRCDNGSAQAHEVDIAGYSTPRIVPRSNGLLDLVFVGARRNEDRRDPTRGEPMPPEYLLEVVLYPLNAPHAARQIWAGYMGDGSGWFRP